MTLIGIICHKNQNKLVVGGSRNAREMGAKDKKENVDCHTGTDSCGDFFSTVFDQGSLGAE